MEPYKTTELQPGRAPQKVSWEKYVAMALILPIACWLLTGVGVTWWFALQVPVTALDIAHSSWLGSPTTALHFTAGPVGIAFTALFFCLGMFIAICRCQPVHGIVFILASVVMDTSLTNESFVRIGLLNGGIKIGCYVPEMRECREQLGMPADGAISRRASPAEAKSGMGYSQQYLTARGKVVSLEQENAGVFLSLPVSPIVLAPLYLGQTEKLKQILETQRADVAAMQKAAASEVPAAAVDVPGQPAAAAAAAK